MVDDQPVSALFAVRVLEQAGMVTEQVIDPLAVLRAMDRFSPDLVLMDLYMPVASGIELTAVIREQERYADLPILFLSVELDPVRQLDALRIGDDDFLAKPMPPQRLVAYVRQRLARARHQAQVRKAAAIASSGATGLVDRERLLVRLDQLVHARALDWGLIYLEQARDAEALYRLAAAASARAGSASTGWSCSCAVSLFSAFAEAFGQSLRADLQADVAATVPAFEVSWCAVPAGGGESVTLVSRARKAARISLLHREGQAEDYQRPSAGPRTVAAPHPVLEAITAGQFQLLFQPMVPLRETAAPCYEATLCLAMPDGELLAPGTFVAVGLDHKSAQGRPAHVGFRAQENVFQGSCDAGTE